MKTYYITRFFSANSIRASFYNRGVVKSVKSSQYTKWIKEQIIDKSYQFVGDVEISIKLYCKNKQRKDIDNLAKPCLDLLTSCGIIKDDSNVQKITLEKVYDNNFNGFDVKIDIEDY